MRIFFVLLASALLPACNFMGGERVTGNGHISSQQKSVGAFTKVEVSGDIKVHVRQDASSSVRIEADENLMPYIEVSTSGNTVTIRTKQGYHLDPTRDVIAYVSSAAFEDIDVSGACDIVGDGTITGSSPLHMEISGSGDISMTVDLPSVSTTVSGDGTISLKGRAPKFAAEVNGSGTIKCFDLVTDNTEVDLSGSADAEVNANKQLNISVSGSGSVRYKGAASVSQSISGSGSVRKEG